MNNKSTGADRRAGPYQNDHHDHERIDRYPAILVHGTLSWGTLTFAGQLPLRAERPVLLPDRRGFGTAPDLDLDRDDGGFTSDYAVDATDLVKLLAGGAHLVGHSYGGTVAMIAAAARPDLVRSLTLIEPCAHMLAADDQAVAGWIERARRFMAEARRGTPETYLDLAYGDGPRPEPAAALLRAARTALHERPCWLADLATEPLARATFPKLVVLGAWDRPGDDPEAARLMSTVGRAVAERIGARLVRVPGAAHDPQRDRAEVVNEILREVWRRA